MTTIAVTGALFHAGKIHKALVVAPLSILGVWDEEFAKFAAFDYTLAVLTGSGVKKADTLRHMHGGPLQVAVVNYESAWRLEKELLAWNPDLVICDESSRIKNPRTKQSKAIHHIGDATRFKMILTGTPITNTPLDFWSQYRFLDSGIFSRSYYAFRATYAESYGYGNYQWRVPEDKLKTLAQKAHTIAFRVTKEEALDLPEKLDEMLYVELEPSAMKIYKQLEKDAVAEIKSNMVTTTNILTKLLRCSQISGGFVGVDESEKCIQVSFAKLQVLSELINDIVIDSGQKLVIVARFIPEIKAVCKLLESKGLIYSVICGETKDRCDEVLNFQNDPNVKIFVAQIATAGMGITLTAANIMIFYSLDYSMSNYEQCKARIHRIGQKHSCTYLHLISRGTIDEKIICALKQKRNVAEAVVDGYRRSL